jgi:hypothetical protein
VLTPTIIEALVDERVAVVTAGFHTSHVLTEAGVVFSFGRSVFEVSGPAPPYPKTTLEPLRQRSVCAMGRTTCLQDLFVLESGTLISISKPPGILAHAVRSEFESIEFT